MEQREELLKLQQQQKKLRTWGFSMIAVGYAIFIPCALIQVPIAVIGMFIAVTGIVLTCRSFFHTKYVRLNQRISQAQNNDFVPPMPNPAPQAAAPQNPAPPDTPATAKNTPYQRDIKKEFLQRQVEKMKKSIF